MSEITLSGLSERETAMLRHQLGLNWWEAGPVEMTGDLASTLEILDAVRTTLDAASTPKSRGGGSRQRHPARLRVLGVREGQVIGRRSSKLCEPERLTTTWKS